MAARPAAPCRARNWGLDSKRIRTGAGVREVGRARSSAMQLLNRNPPRTFQSAPAGPPVRLAPSVGRPVRVRAASCLLLCHHISAGQPVSPRLSDTGYRRSPTFPPMRRPGVLLSATPPPVGVHDDQCHVRSQWTTPRGENRDLVACLLAISAGVSTPSSGAWTPDQWANRTLPIPPVGRAPGSVRTPAFRPRRASLEELGIG